MSELGGERRGEFRVPRTRPDPNRFADLTDPEQHRIEQEKSSRSNVELSVLRGRDLHRRFRVATTIGKTAVIVTRDGQGAD
jgi:hypothetical protein